MGPRRESGVRVGHWGVFGFTEGSGGPRGGGPQASGATPPLALLLPHTSSQHVEGCSGHSGGKGVPEVTKEGGREEAVLPFRSSSHGGQTDT